MSQVFCVEPHSVIRLYRIGNNGFKPSKCHEMPNWFSGIEQGVANVCLLTMRSGLIKQQGTPSGVP